MSRPEFLEVTAIFPEKLIVAGGLDGLRIESVFGDYAAEVSEFVNNTGTAEQIQRGEFIVNCGEAPKLIHVLLSGDASILAGHPQNGLMRIRRAFENEIFGLTEILAENNYSISVLANTICTVKLIPKQDFEVFLEIEESRRNKFIKFLAQKIQSGEHTIHK